jgi:hypothetical protein
MRPPRVAPAVVAVAGGAERMHSPAMTYWQGAARWINGALLAVLAVLLADGLLRLLGARTGNVLVGGARLIAGWLLFPFSGMFAGQPHLVTLVLGVLGYVVVAVVLLTVITARRPAPRPPAHRPTPEPSARPRPPRRT